MGSFINNAFYRTFFILSLWNHNHRGHIFSPGIALAVFFGIYEFQLVQYCTTRVPERPAKQINAIYFIIYLSRYFKKRNDTDFRFFLLIHNLFAAGCAGNSGSLFHLETT